MRNTLSKAAEDKLMRTVERVVSLVEAGSDPHAAMTKAARELQVPRGHLSLACHAYNTGQVNATRESASTALEKFATVALLDPAAVERELFGTPAVAEKTASVHADYQGSADWYKRLPKAAAATPLLPIVDRPTPIRQFTGTFVEAPRTQKIAENFVACAKSAAIAKEIDHAKLREGYAKNVALEAHQAFSGAVRKFANYFHEYPVLRMSFADVEHNLRLTRGEAGQALMDAISDSRSRNEKRAAESIPRAVRIDWTRVPFSLAADALKAAADLADTIQTLKAASDRVTQEEAKRTRPFDHGPRIQTEDDWELFPCQKQAEILGGMATGATFGLLEHAMNQLPSEGGRTQSQLAALNDPAHEEQIRKARIQANLADMIAHDPVIAGHHPDAVAQAYNEISDMAPLVASHPATMRLPAM